MGTASLDKTVASPLLDRNSEVDMLRAAIVFQPETPRSSSAVAQDAMEAGTGFGVSLRECLRRLRDKGYTENLTPMFDHFECQMGAIRIEPRDLIVDELVRFENSSDPDDNAILFAIRNSAGIKGVFVDSFGVYHTELSHELDQKLKDHPH